MSGAARAVFLMKAWLSRNLLALGAVSLLTDMASEMIIPLLPTFLASIGAGAMALGLMEGMADAGSSVLKLFSGRWSDRLGRCRPFILAGYVLSSAAKPCFALARFPGELLALRLLDRAGKGLRSSPRDALLSASTPPEHRGKAFSLHRAMDHLGAVLGPLVALGLMQVWTRELRPIFWAATVPGLLCVIVIALFVKETPTAVAVPPTREAAALFFQRPLAGFFLALALFALGNASDTFLLLKAGEAGVPLELLPLLWAAFHVVKIAASLGSGFLADRVGQRRTVLAGWGVYAAIYAAMAWAHDPATIALLFVIYGLYHGLTEGQERALVAAATPAGAHGAAFGWYHLICGLAALPASVLFGWIYETSGSRAAFLTGTGFALAGSLALAIWRPPQPAR